MPRAAVPGRSAAAATLATSVGGAARGPYKVTAVEYVPSADIVGAATNSLTVELRNDGPEGSALNILVAQLALVAGVNASRRQAKPITLTATNGAPVVQEGDLLRWDSVKVGSGLLDPGGVVHISEQPL
jgi:hypothetical protein